jgi:hypothetical protein
MLAWWLGGGAGDGRGWGGWYTKSWSLDLSEERERRF